MIKNVMKGFFSTPVGFLREMIGKRRIKLTENTHIYKLGKQCQQCHKPIVHRDSISICQCYCFTHKDCLINQLNRQHMSQCSNIQCVECKQHIRTITDFDYLFQPKASLKDLIIISLCVAICCLGMMYLTTLKNIQSDKFTQNDLISNNNNNNQQESSSSFPQVLTLAVIFVFGMLFWITLMGMLFRRKTRVRDISSTNIEIKVSAFLEIETKIKQQSQQHILLKKQSNDL